MRRHRRLPRWPSPRLRLWRMMCTGRWLRCRRAWPAPRTAPSHRLCLESPRDPELAGEVGKGKLTLDELDEEEQKLKIARCLFDRHGAKVVFLGRFVSVLR